MDGEEGCLIAVVIDVESAIQVVKRKRVFLTGLLNFVIGNRVLRRSTLNLKESNEVRVLEGVLETKIIVEVVILRVIPTLFTVFLIQLPITKLVTGFFKTPDVIILLHILAFLKTLDIILTLPTVDNVHGVGPSH
ncbi:uncharacterized protein F5147DRAFT_656971 [Suillus discolor]|uniref:Uncharacterized protein n=1 Tax=Suillus discolor TaxID=1912936 RepID=A0A9P7EYC1_9AGAM|nr:uncharacterized protein F5147DRAFT_656971 [Suillus discolor]KAG2095086.1 hypothetical protein F5147DRAFT_656971 [Suillus discolor]